MYMIVTQTRPTLKVAKAIPTPTEIIASTITLHRSCNADHRSWRSCEPQNFISSRLDESPKVLPSCII